MKNNNIEGMLGSMDLSNVEKKTVALNQSKRLPAIILVDTSGSMSSYENLLKKSVEGLYEAILADRTASNATELAILTFNSDIEILERMREIKIQEAQGKKPLKKKDKKALKEMMITRKKKYIKG